MMVLNKENEKGVVVKLLPNNNELEEEIIIVIGELCAIFCVHDA